MYTASERTVIEALNMVAATGHRVRFWLRDDDAVVPSAHLTLFLDQCSAFKIPVCLAVIPKDTDEALVTALSQYDKGLIQIAVHGWSHQNFASRVEKKQELGAHRSIDVVLEELKAALEKVQSLYGEQAVSMLVPPWNRISPDVVTALPEIGFKAISTFHDKKSAWKKDQPIPFYDTHLDIIDWKAGGVGRSADDLFESLAGLIRNGASALQNDQMIGILTHHLQHDDKASYFLTRLFDITSNNPGCEWSANFIRA